MLYLRDDQLKLIMPTLSPAKRAEFLPLINAALDEYQINTRAKVCSFIANLAHESMELSHWIENMNYSASRLLQVFPKYFKSRAVAEQFDHNPRALANRVYGGRMGNTVTPDDGWMYIARGPIGITGRDMYRRAGNGVGLELESNPELAAQPQHGFRIAAWIWAKEKGLNAVASHLTGQWDRDEEKIFKAICKAINGGYNGLPDRVKYYRRALAVVGSISVKPNVSEATTFAPVPVPTTPAPPAQPMPDAGATDQATVAIAGSAAVVQAATIDQQIADQSANPPNAASTNALKTLWERGGGHLTKFGSWLYAAFQARKVSIIVFTIVIIVGAGVIGYWYRKDLAILWNKLLLKFKGSYGL